MSFGAKTFRKNDVIHAQKSVGAPDRLTATDVTYRAEWEYRNSRTGFYYRVGYLPDNIVVDKIIGEMKHEDLPDICRMLSTFYEQNGFKDKSFVTVNDWTEAKVPSLRVRNAFVSMLAKVNSDYNIVNEKAHLIISSTFLKTAAMLLGGYAGYKMEFPNDLDSALAACRRDQQTPLQAVPKPNPGRKKWWEYRNPVTGMTFNVKSVSPTLYQSVVCGKFEMADIPNLREIMISLYEENGWRGQCFESINDWSEMRTPSLETRTAFAKMLRDVNRDFDITPGITYIVGSSLMVKSAIRLFSSKAGYTIVFKNSMRDAMRAHTGSRSISTVLRKKRKSLPKRIYNKLMTFAEAYCGDKMTWRSLQLCQLIIL